MAHDKRRGLRARRPRRREHRVARARLLPRTSSDLVREGTLQESELDELVAPMLLWKFQLGLFDDPYVDPDAAERLVGSEAHRPLALAGGDARPSRC